MRRAQLAMLGLDVAAVPRAAKQCRRPLSVCYLGRMDYAVVLALQETLVKAKLAGDEKDDLLLVEHPPVYTLGRGAKEADLLGAPERLGVPVFRVGRGGGATFHGPGQVVGYPIVHLHPSGRDVHRYVRLLERSLLETCAHFGVETSSRHGQSGAWVGEEKIASIGVGVRRGVTCHGVALNVTTDISYFDHIVPCRVSDLRVTTLEKVLGWAPEFQTVAKTFARCFAQEMGGDVLDRGTAG